MIIVIIVIISCMIIVFYFFQYRPTLSVVHTGHIPPIACYLFPSTCLHTLCKYYRYLVNIDQWSFGETHVLNIVSIPLSGDLSTDTTLKAAAFKGDFTCLGDLKAAFKGDFTCLCGLKAAFKGDFTCLGDLSGHGVLW